LNYVGDGNLVLERIGIKERKNVINTPANSDQAVKLLKNKILKENNM
jgi:hypothetical protein